MATLIKTDGTKEEVHPEENGQFRLAELQKYVEGFIEMIRWPGKTVFCNEQGKLEGKPFNKVATLEWWAANSELHITDILVGPVLVCGREEVVQGDDEDGK